MSNQSILCRRTKADLEEWLRFRKEAGLRIDPETALVEWCYGQTLDPYGVIGNLPEEEQQVGREYFACSPEEEIWVCFYDLPDATRDRLWELHHAKLVFPAGLESLNTGDIKAKFAELVRQ
jgi:hypothetical protein